MGLAVFQGSLPRGRENLRSRSACDTGCRLALAKGMELELSFTATSAEKEQFIFVKADLAIAIQIQLQEKSPHCCTQYSMAQLILKLSAD